MWLVDASRQLTTGKRGRREDVVAVVVSARPTAGIGVTLERR